MDSNNTQYKYCNWCGLELPLLQFKRNPNYKDGRDNVCKGCRRKRLIEQWMDKMGY